MDGSKIELADGVTLRDYFASQALAGYLAAHAGDGICLPKREDAALRAYEFADAMLKARQPRPAPRDLEDGRSDEEYATAEALNGRR
jgi:hypothetical protein